MNRLHMIVLLGSIVTLLFACAGGKSDKTISEDSLSVNEDSVIEDPDTLILMEEQPVSVRADELFDDFFYNFISDVRFQRSRIDTPMSKHKGSIFEHFSTRDFFSVIYEHEDDLALLKDTTLRNVGVEWIYLDSMNVDRFDFKKVRGEWFLVNRTAYSFEETPNADFLDFYGRFVTDTLTQVESIGEGVSFTLEAQEDDEEVDSIVTPGTWTEFMSDKPLFSPVVVNIDYGQKVEDGNRRDLLFRGFSNGVSIEFQFCKDEGQWFLKAIDI